MDFRLKVFISVADNNSFSKAAKELSLSQPAVTKHIQMLESIYDAIILGNIYSAIVVLAPILMLRVW